MDVSRSAVYVLCFHYSFRFGEKASLKVINLLQCGFNIITIIMSRVIIYQKCNFYAVCPTRKIISTKFDRELKKVLQRK